MATKTSKEENKGRNERPPEITFRCWRCQRDRPIKEMRSVTRFKPALIVCEDCQKEIR